MLFLKQDQELVPQVLVKGEHADGEIVRIGDVDEVIEKPIDFMFPFNLDLQHFLSGRSLLLEEVPFSIEEIHEHVQHGYVVYRQGILSEAGGYRCGRCGNREMQLFYSFRCSRCKNVCVYCRQCIMMGRVTQCTPLLEWKGPTPTIQYNDVLEWSGTLSPSQAEASAKIKEAIRERTDLLVWAVCGAGKTEMLFEGIEEGMRLGLRIAIATPRTDVVLELTPRFRRVFPKVPIASLYGGSEDRHCFAPLVITTTHQLLRFKKAFDVMIIDEVDAFPYAADEMLQHAAEAARTNNSALIFLTATPKEVWQRECYSGKRNCVILPARFHRHPLPIPTFVWCGNWRKDIEKGKIPKSVLKWFQQRLGSGKQALIFFPHIELMEMALPLFREFDTRIESVHSEDPARKEKVQAMRDSKIPILLTTTILERGVTFPNIDVAVVGAEDDTFTESTLVQIAGRVGRSPQYPDGNITFFHHGQTRAMIRARNQLLRMNRDARSKRLVDG
ncbi:DEAD/DEAH box helicase [Caldibacillus thermolactis]|uniref:DEAD/DEAH box helicase n=1 Tax=Pallidibacillus thermolactis TaxID=251051 RepID=A0ABT2WGS0_9BACI|nr:DEAD/DEAH box helicase [Pallidibacillus thermolactis]MCU9594885.1 DEAD/DEAH box helicase [Pallidibacillus thermolactis]